MPSTRLVILGGGPAGNTCATVAATLGAEVTLVERDVVGGAAHLWDCIPSKAMIATGGELSELTRAHAMGLKAEGALDIEALRERVQSIETRLHDSIRRLLESQAVRLIHGSAPRPESSRSKPTSSSWRRDHARASLTSPPSTASAS
jgi:dihydrolipoamide dehydrogenase